MRNYSYNEIDTAKTKKKKNYTHVGLHTHTNVILTQKLS